MTNNDSVQSNPVGRFMVAVGAVIANDKGEMLLVKRSEKLDWQPGEWEITYGRIAQFEDAEAGLKREVSEELGIEVKVGKPISTWHIFRGEEKTAHNELIGITFSAKYLRGDIKISEEHSEYRWVSPSEALVLVKVEGILRDIKKYLSSDLHYS